jgi:hypothetical protein
MAPLLPKEKKLQARPIQTIAAFKPARRQQVGGAQAGWCNLTGPRPQVDMFPSVYQKNPKFQ